MKAWLMDAYRADNKIILWIKTPEEDVRLERGFKAFIYIEAKPEAETFLKKHGTLYFILEKPTYMRKWKRVFCRSCSMPEQFRGFCEVD
jgi:hypothetical protein